jgi:hypothetical protein
MTLLQVLLNSKGTMPDSAQETDLFAKIERLAELHNKGILSSEVSADKKAELLSRL